MKNTISFLLLLSLALGFAPAIAGAKKQAENPKAQNTKNAQDSSNRLADYSKNMSDRLSKGWIAWRPEIKDLKRILLDITVARDGKVLKTRVVESSGNQVWDSEIQKIFASTELPSLPDWYKGESKTFTMGFARKDYSKPGTKEVY